ncbi:MAG: transcription elongation factor GreA [Firmicutes bacterium]|nr:transcription elongation factor GreA [Bacillota bacterium]
MAEEILLTQEGYDKIVAEHEHLVAVGRKEVAERLKEAIFYGDISENAEYDSAKDEQAEIEERILKLEAMIRKAKIIDENEMPKDQVSVGVKVEVEYVDTGDVMEYVIVGSTEADPFAGKISNESLVGQNLLGKKVGEVVEIIVPDGILHLKVKSINK